MHEYTDRLAGRLIAVNAELEQEFETRLVESSTPAFRVAFSVLRDRQDAEEVAGSIPDEVGDQPSVS